MKFPKMKRKISQDHAIGITLGVVAIMLIGKYLGMEMMLLIVIGGFGLIVGFIFGRRWDLMKKNRREYEEFKKIRKEKAVNKI